MKAHYYIGTSGWHYADWTQLFYPPEIKGYYELTYHAEHFNSVENNASFYRISKDTTYKTWARMTPENYTFSLKLNKFITHEHRLKLSAAVEEKIHYILTSTQVLQEKIGALVIQLPASFTYDLKVLEEFLSYFMPEVKRRTYPFDVAIEFRNKHWFSDEVYTLLEKYNVALVAGHSSRYPLMKRITADTVYIRMHGPEKLFASSYSDEQLEEWAEYIRGVPHHVKKVYVYFNNDFHGYALDNAKKLKQLLMG